MEYYFRIRLKYLHILFLVYGRVCKYGYINGRDFVNFLLYTTVFGKQSFSILNKISENNFGD